MLCKSISTGAIGSRLRGNDQISLPQLKPLEAVQFVFDPPFQLFARAAVAAPCRSTDPGPLLHEEFSVLPVGLQVQRGHDLVADHDWQREIAEHALLLRHIGFEQMLVAEEQFCSLALNDQRIERRQDMHELAVDVCAGFEHVRRSPVLLLAGAVERDLDQLALSDPPPDQLCYGRLARRVEMADRIETDDAL